MIEYPQSYPNDSLSELKSSGATKSDGDDVENEDNELDVEKTRSGTWVDEQYIVEYSLEYGYLRLSASSREKLKIPVRVIQLDPQNDVCFGDLLSRFILSEFLGYDDILMASVKVLAEEEDNKGYLR